MLKHLRAGAPIISGIILLLIGIFVTGYYGLYQALPGLDKVMHATGGIIVGWFAFSLLQDDIARARWWRQLIIIVGIVALVGVAWEFAEYTATQLRGSLPTLYHYFHGGDLGDTLGDLTADLLGGVLFAVWALIKER
jgi:arginine exporter protein ArgO